MGDEGEARERDREGRGSQGARLLREEVQDGVGPHQGQVDEEQVRQGCVEEGVGGRSEEMGEEWLEGLVRGRKEGAQRAGLDGLRCDWGQVCGRQGPLREGEVPALSSLCLLVHSRLARRGSAHTSVTRVMARRASVIITRHGRRALFALDSLYTHVAESSGSRSRKKKKKKKKSTRVDTTA